MPVVGLRELSRETREVVERIEATGEPTIVTKHGKPIAALVAVDRLRFEDLVLSAAPDFVDSTREADEALAEGRTRPMSDVLSEMAAGTEHVLASPESTPGQLLSDYEELVDRFSAETARNAIPGDATTAKIERLQSITASFFRELVSQTMLNAVDRVRVATENAVLVGREHGGLDTSFKVLEGVRTAEQLSYRSGRPASPYAPITDLDVAGLVDLQGPATTEVAQRPRGRAATSPRRASAKASGRSAAKAAKSSSGKASGRSAAKAARGSSAKPAGR